LTFVSPWQEDLTFWCFEDIMQSASGAFAVEKSAAIDIFVLFWGAKPSICPAKNKNKTKN
jgi:hypothetical protein